MSVWGRESVPLKHLFSFVHVLHIHKVKFTAEDNFSAFQIVTEIFTRKRLSFTHLTMHFATSVRTFDRMMKKEIAIKKSV